MSLLFSVWRWIHRIRLHLNVLLDLVWVMILVLTILVHIRRLVWLVFKEFSISKSWKLLAQLDVLRLTVMIALSIESFVYWLVEFILLVCLEQISLRALYVAFRLLYFLLYFFFYFTSLWSFSVASPRIQFGFCLLFFL
jgi:hypothetical protein